MKRPHPHAGTPYRSSCRRASTTRLEHQGKAGRHAPHPSRNGPASHTTPAREATTPQHTEHPTHRTPDTRSPTLNTWRYRRLSLPLPHQSPLPGGHLQGATRRYAIGPRADPGPDHPLAEPWHRSRARRRTGQTRPPTKTKPPETAQFITLVRG